MKNKGAKIALIIILSIIVIILISFMIYAIINKVSLIGFGDKTEKIFEKEYEPEQLDSIKVDVSSSNVRIEKADVDKIKITAYGKKGDKIKDTINENKLSIDKENTKAFIFAWCREEVIIQIPNDSDEEFQIYTSSGDVVAPNLETNNIQFETSSGDIKCENINNGGLKSSSGDITIGNANAVTVEASSGNIKVGTLNEGTIKTSSGEINISKIESYCQITTKSGNIDISSLNITENSFITAKSGNVEITEKNDIYVETDTESGDADIKSNNRKSDIILKITTTSGNIKVD